VRVTGGEARGRRLKAPPAGVRPTSDKVRAAIFDALEAQGVDDSRVLDLYAGSGALGIEALSRGAGACDFVERSAQNAAVIRENLSLVGMAGRGRVHCFAVEHTAERLQGPYSLILADPPYDDAAAPAALARLAQSELPAPDATLVLEHSSRREPPEGLGPLELRWSRRYGDTQVSIYRR
jgi:16S rRNA (guanine966-N2)-methyltransferase